MLEIFLTHFFEFLKILEIGENFEWILLLTAYNFSGRRLRSLLCLKSLIKISRVSKTQES